MTDIFSGILEFFQEILDLLSTISESISTTTDSINDFADASPSQSVVMLYLGYMVDVMGRPLWVVFSTLLQIAVGFTIYHIFIEQITKLKELIFK